MHDDTFALKAIGHVRNTDTGARIELSSEYAPALSGLEKISHIIVYGDAICWIRSSTGLWLMRTSPR